MAIVDFLSEMQFEEAHLHLKMRLRTFCIFFLNGQLSNGSFFIICIKCFGTKKIENKNILSNLIKMGEKNQKDVSHIEFEFAVTIFSEYIFDFLFLLLDVGFNTHHHHDTIIWFL